MNAFGKIALSIVIFGISMIVLTLICESLWERNLVGVVYLNTDDGDGGGYMFPGHWVGNDEGFPIVVVDKLNLDPKISDPDELLAGWSKKRLWIVWACYLSVSVFVSVGLASLPWVKLARVTRIFKMKRKAAPV